MANVSNGECLFYLQTDFIKPSRFLLLALRKNVLTILIWVSGPKVLFIEVAGHFFFCNSSVLRLKRKCEKFICIIQMCKYSTGIIILSMIGL